MSDFNLQEQLASVTARSLSLQEELADTDQGLIALTIEHDEQLRTLHDELARTNSELVQLALELEDRVAQRVDELRLAEERYRNIFENAVEGIFQATLAGRFITANPALARMLGYPSPQELMDQVTDIDPMLYVEAEQSAQFKLLLLTEGTAQGFEAQFRRKDGAIIWIQMNARMVRGESSQPDYYEGTIEDVTARKRAEDELRTLNVELEQRIAARTAEIMAVNKELEAFSYSVSHDLRAPLRSIDGFSRILLDENPGDENSQHYLLRVVELSQRMGQLIDDLLSLSRVTRSELSREQVDLSEMAADIIEELRERSPERTVEFVAQPNLTVNADWRLLRIVLENLLGNAWKYSRKQPNARIELGTVEREQGIAYFVRDNGAGFDMRYAGKLFGAFQRLHSEDEFEGTGIGLATVQRIIHRHGGEVWAESAVNQGSTFYFTLSQNPP